MGFENGSSLLYDKFSDHRVIVYGMGATLFLIAMILICILYYLENTNRFKQRINRETVKWYKKACFIIQYIPVIAYLVISYATIVRS